MEHNNGSDSSEHPILPVDVTSSIINEDRFDNERTVGDLASSSNHLEVDIGENDIRFPEFEENSSSSSPSTTPTISMISTSPSISPQNSDLDILCLSPTQSPPIQVMGQPGGYDPHRIPSPTSGSKHGNDSDGSLSSNESLFSIHLGNNDWFDDDLDYSCFSPNADKVIDTSPENETQFDSVQSFGANSSVPNGNGESPTSNSANLVCLSDASCQSASSSAFPILPGGGPSPTKVVVAEAEKQPQSPPSTPPAAEAAQTTPKAPSTTPKAGGNQWSCFSCFPTCC